LYAISKQYLKNFSRFTSFDPSAAVVTQFDLSKNEIQSSSHPSTTFLTNGEWELVSTSKVDAISIAAV
jgi:hypothetical protein